jgi:hypothetical protein
MLDRAAIIALIGRIRLKTSRTTVRISHPTKPGIATRPASFSGPNDCHSIIVRVCLAGVEDIESPVGKQRAIN